MLKMKLSLFAAVLFLCCLGCCYSDEPPLEPCTDSGGIVYIFDTGVSTKVIWGSSGRPLDDWTPETPTGTSSGEDRYVEVDRIPVNNCRAAINAAFQFFRLMYNVKLEDDKKFAVDCPANLVATFTKTVRNVVAGY